MEIQIDKLGLEKLNVRLGKVAEFTGFCVAKMPIMATWYYTMVMAMHIRCHYQHFGRQKYGKCRCRTYR